jgi:hypothetical protein
VLPEAMMLAAPAELTAMVTVRQAALVWQVHLLVSETDSECRRIPSSGALAHSFDAIDLGPDLALHEARLGGEGDVGLGLRREICFVAKRIKGREAPRGLRMTMRSSSMRDNRLSHKENAAGHLAMLGRDKHVVHLRHTPPACGLS